MKRYSDTQLGLRIDVDTYRGTKFGVPNLLKILAEFHIKASFFFSVGPDNMGRNLWRLFRLPFLVKMIRSRAPTLYGWDIILRGTLWKGPEIGQRLPWVIASAFDQGHEIGLHAWDHYAWQNHIERMTSQAISEGLKSGLRVLEKIIRSRVYCSAAPAWRCTARVLIEKEKFPFLYNSDCRGREIFYPIINGRVIKQPQVPVTMPTYDEVIGVGGITDDNYNEYILSFVRAGQLNVITIHAEVEGISRLGIFREFLKRFISEGGEIVPLGSLISRRACTVKGPIFRGIIPGRDGWMTFQDEHRCHEVIV